MTRFLRSYISMLPGDDRYVYLQGQAYWIMANLSLYGIESDNLYLEIAGQCADNVVQRQPPDGAWQHPPLRERKGYISTVEGVWASLGLLSAYKALGKPSYLDSVIKWYNIQTNVIGFESVEEGLAVNYYAHSKSRVPNVTTMFIWLTAELCQITGDTDYLKYTDRMIRFIEHSQLDTGELPYALGFRTHFMCFQYNAFQFLDLANYYQLTGDERVRPILLKMARYLMTGVTARGSSRYSCFKEVPEVHYWTGVLATALRTAHELGLGDYEKVSEWSYTYLLTRQKSNGGYDFSERNYGFLRDKRSYPRYLAMILYHLLYRSQLES